MRDPQVSRRLRARWLAGLLLVSAPAGAAGLWEQTQALRDDAAYQDASPWRRAAMRMLVAELVASAPGGAVPADATARARTLGLDLRLHGIHAVLFTGPGQADGLYAVRVGPGGADLVLQAPHAFSDLGTGALAAALFEEGLGRAVFFNTAHRHGAEREAATGAADVAHRPASLFHAATLGALDALEAPLVVQLHGFGDAHGDWAAVISGGSAVQGAAFLDAARARLEPVLAPWGPVSDGTRVPALAARDNAQGRCVAGQGRFLHLELSREARRGLAEDPGRRAALAEALAGLAGGPP